MKMKLKYLFSFIHLFKIVKSRFNLLILIINPGKERLISLENGLKFYLTHHLDAHIIYEVFINRDYDIKLVNPKIIIDIGAHFGIVSIYYANQYPKSLIYAIEPNKDSYQRLVKNIKLNSASNIKAKNYAITNKSGKKRNLYIAKRSGMSRLYYDQSAIDTKVKQLVKTKSLADFIKSTRAKRIDLVKMDCEGSEYEILLNLEPLIFKKIKAFAIEYHNDLLNFNNTNLVGRLKNEGFKTRSSANVIDKRVGIIKAFK